MGGHIKSPPTSTPSIFIIRTSGGDILQLYSHDNHAEAKRRGHQLPQYYLPNQGWWAVQAREIINAALFTHSMECSHIWGQQAPSSILEDVVTSHMNTRDSAWAFGRYIPNSLPTPRSSHHAHLILHSAIIIELLKYGEEQNHTPTLQPPTY